MMTRVGTVLSQFQSRRMIAPSVAPALENWPDTDIVREGAAAKQGRFASIVGDRRRLSTGTLDPARARPAPGTIRDTIGSVATGEQARMHDDDPEVVRRGVREVLEQNDDIEVVGEAATAEEGLSRIPPTKPDVALIDMRLPDGNGVEVCRDIRSQHGDIYCLILTSFADDEALFDSIMAGAAGYLLKQIKGTDLVDAVRRVAAGQSLLDPEVTARVLERLRKGPEEDERLARLTDQERKILDLIAEGLTNRQIAERMFLAEKTVKNYVSNLLSKLGMERRTEAAVFAARLHDDKERRER